MHVVTRLPALLDLLQGRQLFVQEAFGRLGLEAGGWRWIAYLLVLSVVPALCKEIAFRGLILNGLRRRFPTWPAVLLSSFLFAVYHMNVFAVAPLFVLGVVLGLLAVRSGSLLPGVVLHAGCYLEVFIGPLVGPEFIYRLTGL